MKPLVIPDLALDIDEPESRLRERAARRLGLAPDTILALEIRRRSLDARKGRPLRFVYAVHVHTAEHTGAPAVPPTPPLQVAPARVRAVPPPIVVGAGPAGLFAALTLADHGVPCLLFERGHPVEKRHRDVHALRTRGAFDPNSNICFGEGGAGTYSDGKLFTRKRSPEVARVLARFIAHGASPDIAVDAQPHIGSNRLARIVPRMTAALEDAQVRLQFGRRVERLLLRDGRVAGVVLEDGSAIEGAAVILACGHAARELYSSLAAAGIAMAPKGFAVGFRVEHPQPLIDRIQYGAHADHPRLPAATYRLVRQVGGRGVYSFCMCPGGYVVPTPVEPDHLATNGMSNHARGAPHANSALVVETRADELVRFAETDGPLAGVAFQRRIEAAAFERGGGGYRAPAQRVTDYLAGRASTSLPAGVSFRPGVTPAALDGILPAPLDVALREALVVFGRMMRGFVTEDAVLMAVESMTSAPLTLLRDPARLVSTSHEGLYPAGEGAGHAGGITSSAVDGERAARAVLQAVFGLET